jgi:hypothetical protein
MNADLVAGLHDEIDDVSMQRVLVGHDVPGTAKTVLPLKFDDRRDEFVSSAAFYVMRQHDSASESTRIQTLGETVPCCAVALKQFDESRPNETGPAGNVFRVLQLQPLSGSQRENRTCQSVIEPSNERKVWMKIVLAQVGAQSFVVTPPF